MPSIRVFITILRQNMGKLRQQVLLLAGLSLLCTFFAWQAGETAEKLLTNGVNFQRLTIAITAPEGDTTGETLSLWMGKLQDVKSYCSFLAMNPTEAEEALRQGEISAVLALPEDFIDGVLTGENPDVILTVSAERPLEALLANWVGGSAADLLMTFQQGIYAVLDVYDHTQPTDINRDDVVFGINLRYINWALGRESCFRTEMVSATGSLPLNQHYKLSLAAYFLIALAPALSTIYDPKVLRAQRRLRCIGVGVEPCFAAAVFSGIVIFLPAALIVLFTAKLPLKMILIVAVLWAVMTSLWGCLLCLLLPDSASRGMASFLLALLSLVLAGGLLPPTMLPSTMKAIGEYSLVSIMRNLAAGENAATLLGLTGYFVGLNLTDVLLYRKRMEGR